MSIIDKSVYEAEIIDINSEGNGVVKIEGFTVFLDGGVIGDKVRFKVIEIKKSFGKGLILNIVEESKDRIKSKCEYSEKCGGCQFQEISYENQLKYKKAKVENDLLRIGGIEGLVVEDVIAMDDPYRYRNKVQVPVGFGNNDILIGFYEKASRRIVDRNKCIIQSEIADIAEDVLKNYMRKYNIKAYNNKLGKGFIRHIIIRNTYKTNETMIILVTTKGKIEHLDELIHEFKKNIPTMTSFVQSINNKRSSDVLGSKSTVLYGENYILDTIGDLKFKISAESFYQVNPVQTEKLYEKVLEFADLKGEEEVIDLYCGIGTISLFLAKNAKKVYGIESVKEAIINAKSNARINKIENVDFTLGLSEEVMPKLYESGIRPDLIVLDPPRKGAEEVVLDTIAKMSVEKIVYVSCNPSTLARDLKSLVEKGYEIKTVQPVDMFPQTSHVETIALLQRKIM